MKVYAELEATPDRGREFASAIRHLMQACCLADCVDYMLHFCAAGSAYATPSATPCRHAAHFSALPLPPKLAVGGRVGGVEAEQLPRSAAGAPAGRGAARRCRRRSRCVAYPSVGGVWHGS